MRVIMVGNQKGGIGKTTTTIELCYIFGQKYRVLGIDLDGSRNFSKCTGAVVDGVSTIREVLNGDCLIEDAIQHLSSGFDVIPAAKKLADSAKEFCDPDDIYLLKDALADIAASYDFVFIDNAPARAPLLFMSYVASDYCLAVTEGDENSIDGLKELGADILRFKERGWTQVKILGFVLNKAEKTGAHKKAVDDLKALAEQFNTVLLNTSLRKGIVATDCKEAHIAITELDSRSKLSTDYQALADEILDKIGK